MDTTRTRFFFVAITLCALLGAPLTASARKPVDTQPNPTVANQGPRFDVVFVIDATGSMADEIDVVKKQIWDMAKQMMDGTPKPDIRFGLVFYRDTGDSELLRVTELTREVGTVEQDLMGIVASGGGDWEEHVGRGLHAAIGLNWDTAQSTTRLVYLVGDAPPHYDYQDGFDVQTALKQAAKLGVVVHTIGCSGLDSGAGDFERIAQATDGNFKYLTYHAVVADADGRKRSVIYEGGEYYEADEVLSDTEWRKGAGEMKKSKRVRKADGKTASAAKAAPTTNNLDSVVNDSVMEAAEAQGVAY